MFTKKINSIIFITFLTIFTSSVLFTSCSKQNSNTTGNIHITASFYPLYVMLLNITEGTNTEVNLLAPPQTGCLHDYQLTTNDMKKLEKSNVIVVNGAGMEDFLDKAIFSSGKLVITASKDFNLVDDNAHIWVSPKGAVHQVTVIADGLAAIDSENAEIYKKNAEEYIRKITTLSEEMHNKLDSFAGRSIITFHEAFPYFADEFNLTIAGVIEREPGEEPSAKELLELIDTIKEISKTSVPTLFAETQYSSTAAETIAKETGLRVYELDPAVTGDSKQNISEIKNSYINAMKKNAAVLEEALSQK